MRLARRSRSGSFYGVRAAHPSDTHDAYSSKPRSWRSLRIAIAIAYRRAALRRGRQRYHADSKRPLGMPPGLILKRASTSRSSGEWNDDDFDVLADGAVVGRIFKANAAPVGSPWMWTLAFGHHEDRTPTHGYAATREAAMRAFAESWRRESAAICW